MDQVGELVSPKKYFMIVLYWCIGEAQILYLYFYRLAFRGVAGAYLYTVNVDGDAIAILEDRQKEVEKPTSLYKSTWSSTT